MWPRTIVDDTGARITLSAKPARIVSLAPSNTEILFDLGVGRSVVGDTTACDYPAAARQVPKVGGYPIREEAVLARNADLVVAVQSINGPTITALRRLDIPTLVVNPRTIRGVYRAIQMIGTACGASAKAGAIVASMRGAFKRLSDRTARAKSHPKVLIAYGANPVYTTGSGSFIDDVVRIAGGANIAHSAASGGIISSEEVIAARPDDIICSPDLQASLMRLPGWNVVPAIRFKRFFAPSDPETLERPGPRLARAALQLAEYLHPRLFNTRAFAGSPNVVPKR
ncbi:MAG: ABC transporter substrate-binding protein [Armatimonadetes bacterium]|nr:ABC transporter substrate-binding protein [Armatimonadota bacterium]MDE2205412.1 ABC transporter substrate-binding protein [Armatimonadota bacterium]